MIITRRKIDNKELSVSNGVEMSPGVALDLPLVRACKPGGFRWLAILFAFVFASLPSLSAHASESNEQLLFEVFEVLDKLTAEIEQIRSTEGEAALADRIEHNAIQVSVEGVGKAEASTIDGHLFSRVVHEGTGLAFLIMDAGNISPDSKHLRQYVARQHIDANDLKGRDVSLLWMENGAVAKTEYRPRHEDSGSWKKWLSRGYWREWADATYKKPTMGYFKLALLSTSLQIGMATIAAGIKVALNPAAPFEMNAAILCIPYGMGIGTFYQTYRNWSLRGGKDVQKLKTMLTTSASFAYLLHAMSSGQPSLTEATVPAMLGHLGIWANVWVSTKAKVEWDQIVVARREARENTRDWEPGGYKTALNQGAVESQALYAVGPMTFRLMDLTGVTAMGLPVGKLLFFSSIPLAAKISYMHAQYLDRKIKAKGGKGFEHLERAKANWEFVKRHPLRYTFDIPMKWPEPLRRLGARLKKAYRSTCEVLLTPIGSPRKKALPPADEAPPPGPDLAP